MLGEVLFLKGSFQLRNFESRNQNEIGKNKAGFKIRKAEFENLKTHNV